MLKDYLDALKKAVKSKDKKTENAILKKLNRLGMDTMTAYELIKK